MKKINKLLKMILVLCLTISQFTPLISVNAEEIVSSTIDITLGDKNYLTYNSNSNFEEGNYYFTVKGTYTYLDNTTETIDLIKSPTINDKNINGYSIQIPKYSFDGTYNFEIELYKEDNTLITSSTYSESVEYQSGLKITTSSNVNNGELSIDDAIDKNVTVEVTVLPGKLAPTYKYSIPTGTNIGNSYLGKDLNGLKLNSVYNNIGGNVNYENYLYNTYLYQYNIEFDVTDSLNNNLDKLALSNNLNIKYGEMSDNDEHLTAKNKIGATFENNNITLKSYTNATTDEQKLTIDEVISDIKNNVYINRNYEYKAFDSEANEITDYTQLINNNMVIKISYMGVTLSYTVNFENDYNKDTYFNELDLLPAIENFISGDQEIEKDTTDTTKIINQINDKWNNSIGEVKPVVSLNGSDVVNVDDELVLTYDISNLGENIVNAFGGIINYDSAKLELISITSNDNWVGSFSITNNKVLFASTVGSINGTILTIKFKALSESAENGTEVSLSNVSLAINNSSSNLVNYDLSKKIKILTNYGVGGNESAVPLTLTTNTENLNDEVTEILMESEEKTEDLSITKDKKEDKDKDTEEVKEQNKTSRVVIVILIVLVIAGLVYLIFKDDEEENEEIIKNTNKTEKSNQK